MCENIAHGSFHIKAPGAVFLSLSKNVQLYLTCRSTFLLLSFELFAVRLQLTPTPVGVRFRSRECLLDRYDLELLKILAASIFLSVWQTELTS